MISTKKKYAPFLVIHNTIPFKNKLPQMIAKFYINYANQITSLHISANFFCCCDNFLSHQSHQDEVKKVKGFKDIFQFPSLCNNKRHDDTTVIVSLTEICT